MDRIPMCQSSPAKSIDETSSHDRQTQNFIPDGSDIAFE